MRLKGLGLGRVGMKKLKNSHKGRVVRKFRTRGCVVRISHKGMCYAKISHKGMCCAKISHKALFTHPNAKLDSFKWP